MAPRRNLTLIFARVPCGLPKPGVDLTVEDHPLDLTSAPNGGFVTQNLYSSLDPYMRNLLVDESGGSLAYRPAFKLGEAISSACLARILTSEHSEYEAGQVILAQLPIQEYSAVTPDYLSAIQPPQPLHNPRKLTDLRLFLGPLGAPGLTAYSSLYEICRPQKGETVYVSAASGAVGQLVGQLAKREGCIVIGSVGSQAKVDFVLKELCFDGAFNYVLALTFQQKTEEPAKALRRLAPGGLDIYYDNVGGEQLEKAVSVMKTDGRIALCGMISQYNLEPSNRYGVRNLFQFMAKGLRMQGFRVRDNDFGPKWREEFEAVMGKALEEGSIKALLDEVLGVENAAEAFSGMLVGRNFGKAVVRIHADDDGTIAEAPGAAPLAQV